MTETNEIIFLEVVAQPEIAASTTEVINIQELRAKYGNDFNTLTLTNTDATYPAKVHLDGKEVAYLPHAGGIFQFDWQDGILYNQLALEQPSAAAVIAADNIKITVGRTGKK